MSKPIKVAHTARGISIDVPYEKLLELREELISSPGLSTKPAKERTPLEELAIKVTDLADKYERMLKE